MINRAVIITLSVLLVIGILAGIGLNFLDSKYLKDKVKEFVEEELGKKLKAKVIIEDMSFGIFEKVDLHDVKIVFDASDGKTNEVGIKRIKLNYTYYDLITKKPDISFDLRDIKAGKFYFNLKNMDFGGSIRKE